MMAFLQLMVLVFIGFHCAGQVKSVKGDFLQNEISEMPATGDVCKDCTQIFELLKDLLSDVGVQGKLKNSLGLVCNMLPGHMSKSCQEQVEKNFPLALTLLDNMIKPKDICNSLGLCTGEVDVQMQEQLANLYKTLKSHHSENVDLKCTFCIYLIQTVQSLIPKEKTEAAVSKALSMVCEILPGLWRDQCRTLVNQYSHILIEMLMHSATPQAICAVIHLCKGMDTTPMVNSYACALSTTYRCRDMQTAMKCGSVHLCLKEWL
ncbi:surfactant protein Ba [Denticeps clupeoides]|uniref:surfactant protein Ba n=1 Tax=Denticeps clupeoides TaxID=299321 RepID=UPI0010A418DB|nr:pulmonary surfactant-associated protein B [Denticeps clupeoides]